MKREIFCPDTKETVYNYEDYLKTKHWRKKKAEYKDKYKYQCTMCDRTSALDLHHITYKHIGNEDVEKDLVYLCKICHGKVHAALRAEETALLNSLSIKKRNKQKRKIICDCLKCGNLKINRFGDTLCGHFQSLNPNEKSCREFHYDERIAKRNQEKRENIKETIKKFEEKRWFRFKSEVINLVQLEMEIDSKKKIDEEYLKETFIKFHDGRMFSHSNTKLFVLTIEPEIKITIEKDYGRVKREYKIVL